MQNTLHYDFCDEGIRVSTEVEVGEGAENSSLLAWDQIYKIVETKKQLLIYSGRMNAYIIPVEQLGERKEELKSYIKERTEDYRLSFRK